MLVCIFFGFLSLFLSLSLSHPRPHPSFFHLQITELPFDKLGTPCFQPKATLIALICSDNRTTGREKTRQCGSVSAVVTAFAAQLLLSFLTND